MEWTFSPLSHPSHIHRSSLETFATSSSSYNNRMWEVHSNIGRWLNWNKSSSWELRAKSSAWRVEMNSVIFRTARRSPVSSILPTTSCWVWRKSFWLTFFFYVQSTLVWISLEYLTLKYHHEMRGEKFFIWGTVRKILFVLLKLFTSDHPFHGSFRLLFNYG